MTELTGLVECLYLYHNSQIPGVTNPMIPATTETVKYIGTFLKFKCDAKD